MKKIYLIILMGSFVFAACRKQDTNGPMSCGKEDESSLTEDASKYPDAELMNTDVDFKQKHSRLSFKTLFELEIARLASIKYRNIERAFDDEYVDIEVKAKFMGYHFMRKNKVDNVFDPARPEILVYNKNRAGKYELVAVEYAQPLSDVEPKGFTGNADHWDHNVGFNLWLLHAWVWQFNPDGVFNPTNPTVHVR